MVQRVVDWTFNRSTGSNILNKLCSESGETGIENVRKYIAAMIPEESYDKFFESDGRVPRSKEYYCRNMRNTIKQKGGYLWNMVTNGPLRSLMISLGLLSAGGYTTAMSVLKKAIQLKHVDTTSEISLVRDTVKAVRGVGEGVEKMLKNDQESLFSRIGNKITNRKSVMISTVPIAVAGAFVGTILLIDTFLRHMSPSYQERLDERITQFEKQHEKVLRTGSMLDTPQAQGIRQEFDRFSNAMELRKHIVGKYGNVKHRYFMKPNGKLHTKDEIVSALIGYAQELES